MAQVNMRDIILLLEAVPLHFGQVAATEDASLQAIVFARRLEVKANKVRQAAIRGVVDDAVQQQLEAAARTLTAFASAAARAFASGSAPRWLHVQVCNATNAAASCMLLASALRLSFHAAFTIAAACSLIFGPMHALTVLTLSGDTRALDWKLWRQHCSWQLVAVAGAVASVAAQHPNVAAAFAASTAKQSQLMPWLATLTRALLLMEEGSAEEMWAIGSNYATLLQTLLTAEPYARHREELAGNSVLQQAAADVLLTVSLPSLAGVVAACQVDSSGSSRAADVAEHLVEALQHPFLVDAATRRLQGPNRAAAIRHAAAAVQALPLARPAGPALQDAGEAAVFDLHCDVMVLLCWCFDSLVEEARGSGSSSPAGASTSDRRQAAWQLAALLPQLAAVLQAIAGNLQPPAGIVERGWLANLDTVCNELASTLLLVQELGGQPASAQQLGCWAAAATAGLRLQPLLLQLDSMFQQVQRRPAAEGGDDRRGAGAWRLAGALLHIWRSMPVLDQAAAGSTGDKQLLVGKLAELHSTGCRYAHLIASCGTSALPVNLASRPVVAWDAAVVGLSTVLDRMLRLGAELHSAEGEDDEATEPADVPGQCAAQLHAVLAVAAAAAEADGFSQAVADDPHWPTVLRVALAVSIRNCCCFVEAAWDSPTVAEFERLMGALAQVSSPLELASELLYDTAHAAAHRPRIAASLANGSLPGRMLEVARQLAGSAERDAAEWASKLLEFWRELVHGMAQLLSGSSDFADQAELTDDTIEQLQEAVGVLVEHQQLGSSARDASPAERAQQLQQAVLPHAARLASLLAAGLQSPRVEAQRRLELARAAATRSCAYLRCSNVAGQGGPAAGQGVGSKRCSACRAVWYCGTACSHADWRAGHKRVCKALAAERQAAKAARAAAAAEAAAAEAAAAAEGQQQEAA